MVGDGEDVNMIDSDSADTLLHRAQGLVRLALDKARQVEGFTVRWKTIVSRIEQVPSRLSDLSSHPCFSKILLCSEQLQAVSATLRGTIVLAEACLKGDYEGKLQMQSDLDALLGRLDLHLRDCGVLIKTGVLGEAAAAMPGQNVKELLARLQIGHLEAKHRALDGLWEAMRDDQKSVVSAMGRSNVGALVQLLTATSPRIRDKAVAIVCSLAESGSCENWLASEGVLPPLVRLVESSSAVGRQKAVISLQRLSMSADTARSVAGHGGVRPLIDVCRRGDSVSQAAAACALKNLSAVPELRWSLAEEGIVRAMIDLIDYGILLGSKEHASECLQNLTATGESLQKSIIAEGGIRCLLAYLDGPLPQESAVAALRNLIGSVSVSTDVLVSLGLFPRLSHVFKAGSPGAQHAAASAICRVCSVAEVKKLVGEAGCIPLLVDMLDSKILSAREVAAQAISSLVTLPQNRREVKRNEKSVPSLVQLLDASPQNTAQKYAVCCLASLSSSNKCRKLMVSYGANGYLKKLMELDVPGAKKLQEQLAGGKLRSLFCKK